MGWLALYRYIVQILGSKARHVVELVSRRRMPYLFILFYLCSYMFVGAVLLLRRWSISPTKTMEHFSVWRPYQYLSSLITKGNNSVFAYRFNLSKVKGILIDCVQGSVQDCTVLMGSGKHTIWRRYSLTLVRRTYTIAHILRTPSWGIMRPPGVYN